MLTISIQSRSYRVNFGPRAEISARAAALDSRLPMGKSPGRGPESVAVTGGFRSAFSITCGFLTVGGCCFHSLRKPVRQCAVSCIRLQLGLSHSIEKLMQIDGLGTVNPLACGVDLGVGLH